MGAHFRFMSKRHVRPATAQSRLATASVSPTWRERRSIGALGLVCALCALVAACAANEVPEPKWPAQAEVWFERARTSYMRLDTEDARHSIDQALKMTPDRPEAKVLAGRIELSQLEYAAALARVQGIQTADARALRGRALWYSGDMAAAADALDELLTDPEVRDPWASGVVKLARTGRGRKPFSISGERLAVIEMPRVSSTSMVVPVELNGQPVLALIATGSAEVVVDAPESREPSWVSLRFQKRVEVKDVPALTQDLSGLSRELNAPIKVLLGTNLLRHLNVTFDYMGRQFVVRNYEPPPPPGATKLDLAYIRGGGMVVTGQIGLQTEAPRFSLFVDTGRPYPLVLDEPAWEKTNVPATQRKPVATMTGVTQAALPQLRLGSYDIGDVTALGGVPFEDLEKALDVELDGLLGAGVLSEFRITLGNGGRSMWIEGMPTASRPAPVTPPAPEVPAPAQPPSPAQPG